MLVVFPEIEAAALTLNRNPSEIEAPKNPIFKAEKYKKKMTP